MNLNAQFWNYLENSKLGDKDKFIINLFKDFLLEKVFVREDERCKIDDIRLKLENFIRALAPSGEKSFYVTDDNRSEYKDSDVFYNKCIKETQIITDNLNKNLKSRILYKNQIKPENSEPKDQMIKSVYNLEDKSREVVLDSMLGDMDPLSNLMI